MRRIVLAAIVIVCQYNNSAHPCRWMARAQVASARTRTAMTMIKRLRLSFAQCLSRRQGMPNATCAVRCCVASFFFARACAHTPIQVLIATRDLTWPRGGKRSAGRQDDSTSEMDVSDASDNEAAQQPARGTLKRKPDHALKSKARSKNVKRTNIS